MPQSKDKVSSPKETDFRPSESAVGENTGTASSNNAATEANRNGQATQDRPSAEAPRRRKKQFAVSTRWEQEVAERGQPRDMHSFCCCCARRVGNMFILLEYADGSPIIVAGPCWPFCLFVTVPLILGISGLVSYFLVLNEDSGLPSWIAYVYFPCVAAVLLALCCVSCRNPGLMERVTDEEAGEGGWFWNEQVGSFRPPGALYCRECGVLIQEYDHLCPWTGTGIGHGNMLAFKIFVVGVNILCYFSIILLVWSLLDGLVA